MTTFLIIYSIIALVTTVSLLCIFTVHNGLFVTTRNDVVKIQLWACVGLILIGIFWPVFAILVFIGWIMDMKCPFF